MDIPSQENLIDYYAADSNFRRWVVKTLDEIKTLLEAQSALQAKVDNLTAEIVANTTKMQTVQK